MADDHRILGMRLVNIYDVNAKTYIFKFARNEEKVFVLIESGLRMHSTEFFRDKNQMPSGFTMKVSNPALTRLPNLDEAPLHKTPQALTRCPLTRRPKPGRGTPSIVSQSHACGPSRRPSSPQYPPPLLPLPTPRPSCLPNPVLVPPHPLLFLSSRGQLRKHVRTRRLVGLTQLGSDRIVDFDFTGAEFGFHIFVEFYASVRLLQQPPRACGVRTPQTPLMARAARALACIHRAT